MHRESRPFSPGRPAIAETAAGAVVLHGAPAEMLLLHHRVEERWCLPKGHVEAGETLESTARREVAEETGLRALDFGEEIRRVSYQFYDPRRDVNVFKTTVYFLARTRETAIVLEPIFDRHAWVDLRAALDWVAYDTDRAVADAAIRRLGGIPMERGGTRKP